MSDWIEVDGKKYYEEGYLELANNNSKRRGEKIKELEKKIEEMESDLLFLNCLQCAGVDNWDGYDFAVEDFHERTE